MRPRLITRRRTLGVLVSLAAALAIIATSCSQSSPTPTPQPYGTSTQSTKTPVATPTQSAATPTPNAPGTTSNVSLLGAGSTFAYPLYSTWFDAYYKLTGVKVNYQSIGSGGGIQQITAGTVDFGASDGIMTDQQQAAAEAAYGPIMHIPTASGAVAIIYNLPGVAKGQLKLTPDVLADIYLKNIKKWNDPRIVAINPGLNLPDAPIAVVHRSEGSGTTYIFTNYLSKVSQEWATKVGNAISVEWPGDLGGKGSEGVAGLVQQTPDSIGYDEMAYADTNNLPWAQIMNAAGTYVQPSIQATVDAAQGVPLPDDMKVMITNSSNSNAYPICGFTWVLAYKNARDPVNGKALANMLWWGVRDGQKYEAPLDYAPLSPDAVKKVENEILSMNYNGQPLVTR